MQLLMNAGAETTLKKRGVEIQALNEDLNVQYIHKDFFFKVGGRG